MKDKITLLCVEDGSVDLEELENLEDGKVLTYRKGSRPPYVLEISMPRKPFVSQEKWNRLRQFCEDDTTSYFARRVLDFMKEIEMEIEKEELGL